MWARKIVNCFCLHSYNRRSLISRFLRGWQLKSWCRSGRESSEGKSIFNTWQPRSNFIYSINNTRLLTAGCYKSDLRHLKHWDRLLLSRCCEINTRRSRVYEAFPYSENIFPFKCELWKHNSCSGFIFIPGKNLRAPSTAFLNSSLRLCP